MYQPVQNGIAKSIQSVIYEEASPSDSLMRLMHCYWQLKTRTPLPEDFKYHILPDACIDIIFDFSEPELITVMTPGTSSLVLNLGKNFSYLGIRLLPGIWKNDLPKIIGDYKKYPTLGDYSIRQLTKDLESKDFAAQRKLLTTLVERLYNQNIIKLDSTIQCILLNINKIKNVADMTQYTHLSSRQLQRKIKKLTGFSPHDFLKILRLQQSFGQDYLDLYADQSHFINSFHKITNYTPLKYKNTFDV